MDRGAGRHPAQVSFHGAAFAADEIERRCGVHHTVRAVEMRASRIHCSLAVQTVCPECGRMGLTLNRQTGMCPLCAERYHLEQKRAFNEQLERERAEVEESGGWRPRGASETGFDSATAGRAASTG